jgi:hypothetical protein
MLKRNFEDNPTGLLIFFHLWAIGLAESVEGQHGMQASNPKLTAKQKPPEGGFEVAL